MQSSRLFTTKSSSSTKLVSSPTYCSKSTRWPFNVLNNLGLTWFRSLHDKVDSISQKNIYVPLLIYRSNSCSRWLLSISILVLRRFPNAINLVLKHIMFLFKSFLALSAFRTSRSTISKAPKITRFCRHFLLQKMMSIPDFISSHRLRRLWYS